jgi:hypothetical protein
VSGQSLFFLDLCKKSKIQKMIDGSKERKCGVLRREQRAEEGNGKLAFTKSQKPNSFATQQLRHWKFPNISKLQSAGSTSWFDHN